MYSTTININKTSMYSTKYPIIHKNHHKQYMKQRVTTFNDELFLAKCSTSRKWGRLVCAKWEAVIQRGENAIIITGIGQNEIPSA